MKKILFFVLTILLCKTAAYAQTPQYTYTNNATGGNFIPFGVGSGWDNYRSQFLYLPGDFPTLSQSQTGFITKIYFKGYNGYPTTNMVLKDLTVAIGNTTVTGLTNYVSGLTPCYYNASFNSGPISNSWWEIPLQTMVYFDPSQPLVVDCSQTGGSGGLPVYAGGTPVNATYTGNTHVYGPTSSSSGTPRRYSYQFGFDFFAGYPCTDTPKSDVKAPKWVCPGDTFKVSPKTYYANATYQWQWSKDGINWSNYTGSLGQLGDITQTINEPMWYRVKINCNANTNLKYISPSWKVSLRPFYYCYCKNKSIVTSGLDIGNFTIVNNSDGIELLNNGNPLPPLNNTAANRDYTSFMDTMANSQNVVPVNLYRDSTYEFRVTQMNSGNSVVSGTAAIFLDWNRDGSYDQITELVMEQTITAAGQMTWKRYKIPSNAEIGITGLRVILQKGTPVLPCGNFGEGETEDYIVNLNYEPCKGPVNGGKVEGDTSVCWGYDYIVTDTTYERRKSNFTRNWQVSGDNKMWLNITGSDDKDTLMRTFIPAQPLFYRNRLVCKTTNDTSYSQVLKLKIKDGYKCYCFSQAVGGRALDTSDAGGFSLAAVVNNDGGTHLMNAKATNKRTDHTDEPAIEMDSDSLYQMTVFHTMSSTIHSDAKVTVFMDFNNNTVYDLPEDLVYKGYTSIGTFTLVDNVKVKPIAIYDVPTGMRVILNNDIAPNIPSDEACGVYTSGETEDYMIMFRKKIPANVNVINGIDQFGLYPNPTSGKFTLSFKAANNIKEVELSITNVTGQQVKAEHYTVSGAQFTKDISLEEQAKGIYFVELKADGQKMVRKLVVE